MAHRPVQVDCASLGAVLAVEASKPGDGARARCGRGEVAGGEEDTKGGELTEVEVLREEMLKEREENQRQQATLVAKLQQQQDMFVGKMESAKGLEVVKKVEEETDDIVVVGKESDEGAREEGGT